jgi:hypothetical protein
MADLENIKNELKQMRDEVELKIHLGSMEAKQKWEELEGQWDRFSERAEIQKTTDDVDHAFDILGDELKKGYKRLKDAL